jgi:hypothetical protein
VQKNLVFRKGKFHAHLLKATGQSDINIPLVCFSYVRDSHGKKKQYVSLMYITDKCSARKISGSEFCTPQGRENLSSPSRTDCLREYPASGLFLSENRGG